MSATYSPEDNKLRLYVGRVTRADYERLRAAGYISTPKQDCDFVATWTPSCEDLAREFLEDDEDIGDEDYSPLERSADRAERFEGYREKRTDEATSSADLFEEGPQAFGHQNQQRAERQAIRHDRNRTYAVSQWSKAEYWQTRTAGVISHALYKSSARVRRGRILTLEAEQRKHEKTREEYATRFQGWQTVLTLEGELAAKLAYALVNTGHCWGEYVHPRTGKKTSMYSLLTDAQDPLTPIEAANLWLANRAAPDNPNTSAARWSAHYELRLTYERAMLAQEGGSAAEADMEPGGWIRTGNRTGSVFTDVATGWKQIQSVNKSPVTGRVTSVKVWGTTSSAIAERHGKAVLVSVNIERLGEDSYRAPTDEERAAFAVETKERKQAEKATKPKEPPLINPTDEDAHRLQDLWNTRAKAKHDARPEAKYLAAFVPAEVVRMTQEQYSQVSKGSYAKAETRTLHAGGMLARRASNMWTSEGSKYDKEIGAAQCKIRVTGYSPVYVIVITDKPQKPLPIDWIKPSEANTPTETGTLYALCAR